jgi:hypothetical protein
MYSLKAANPERRANGDELTRAFSSRHLPVYVCVFPDVESKENVSPVASHNECMLVNGN